MPLSKAQQYHQELLQYHYCNGEQELTEEIWNIAA